MIVQVIVHVEVPNAYWRAIQINVEPAPSFEKVAKHAVQDQIDRQCEMYVALMRARSKGEIHEQAQAPQPEQGHQEHGG